MDASSRTIPAAQFRDQCLRLMDEVRATGETLIVTKHGRPVAAVVPYTEQATASIIGWKRRHPHHLGPRGAGDSARALAGAFRSRWNAERRPAGRRGVSPALILDTGVLLWMSQGSEHLGPRTKAMIEEADREGSLSFSAVSMLEVAPAPRGRQDRPAPGPRTVAPRAGRPGRSRDPGHSGDRTPRRRAREQRGLPCRPRRPVDRGDRRRCAPPTRHLRPEDPALGGQAHRAQLSRRPDLAVLGVLAVVACERYGRLLLGHDARRSAWLAARLGSRGAILIILAHGKTNEVSQRTDDTGALTAITEIPQS